ncbi:hypothetical protein BDA96_04G301800 [Sorghum bicolor]|uniref:Uncharacterized protein n=1 Tax=Sorghum bicolor TaxID=4558 RepID=A0A921R6J0_SORBI|nr:hypothetical protein BDA96_04G301800 [Sorghum bicolor]
MNSFSTSSGFFCQRCSVTSSGILSTMFCRSCHTTACSRRIVRARLCIFVYIMTTKASIEESWSFFFFCYLIV